MNLYRKVLHLGFETYLRGRLLAKLLTRRESFKQDSYYPDLPLKSPARQFLDHLLHVLKYGEINRFYYMYGFDVIGLRNSLDYIDYRSFMNRRNRLNLGSPHNYSCILRDKSLFAMVAAAFGMPAIRELGVYSFGGSYLSENRGGEILSLLQKNPDLFFKPIDAECGEGIFCMGLRNQTFYFDDVPIDRGAALAKLCELKGRYLIQTRLVQHEQMNRLYAHSVNTLRIVSVFNHQTNEVEILHALLRMGVHGNVVDNWAKGGIQAAVDSEGRLSEYGFYKPGYGGKTKFHPDSHIEFHSFIVPYYAEALQHVKTFHRRLSGIHSIGWDVAITSQGPVFIEGNDNWEISLHQSFCGLKSEIERLFVEH